MRTPAPRLLSAQRLDRMLLFSRLWLLKLAGLILQIAGAYAPLERAIETALHKRLDRFTNIACAAIALKAHARTRPHKHPRRFGKTHKRCANLKRAFLGARLRKLAKAKHDPRARIAALLMLIQNAETEIARFARRIQSGLTRRLGGVALCTLIGEASAPAPRAVIAIANTS